jgi:hypothetical protein
MSERPSPLEFIKTSGETDRLKENKKRTEQITRILVENSGVFGGEIEEERSQVVCQEVLGVFGAGYKSVERMKEIANPGNKSSTERQKKMANENLGILGNSAFKAINYSFKEYPNGLITSALTAEQIDNFLPNEIKGLGKDILISDTKASKEEKEAIFKMDFSNKKEQNRNKKKDNVGYFASTRDENGDWEGGSNVGHFASTRDENGNWDLEGGSRWEVSKENAAEAMKYMAYDLRWQSWTPPEWFKKLDGETQARIEYMVMINDGAASLSYAGKDLDKIQGNKMYFAFDNEKFTRLFNEDFKLVMSKMLNDLCELDRDKSGKVLLDKNEKPALRYKEGKNSKKEEGILEKVEKKLEKIRDYKEELAAFLAKQHGREKSDYMDKMNAYTAWNLFYMFGDSSVADRRRALPTYGGIIADSLRTLNPEYKALGKWKISKGDSVSSKKEETEAEWFGGPIGSYVQTVMQLERDLGNPITGDKTLKEKILDGQMSLLATKTFYGFLDFTSGGRDLYDLSDKNEDNFYDEKKGKTKKETLATLLMDYASFDKDGNLTNKNKRRDFDFGHKQVDFLNWYRDQMEASALVLDCTTGKVKVDSREIRVFVSKIRTAFGMINGIKINGDRMFKYTTDPNLWADIMLGSFGVDMQRLSTDYIFAKATQDRAYNLNLGAFLTRGLALTNKDVNLIDLMTKLGVDINHREKYDGLGVTIRNERRQLNLKKKTTKLKKEAYISSLKIKN